MNNTSPNQDITPNNTGMNPNLYTTNENMMFMPAAMPNLVGGNAVTYPDIYYKLQPHIMMMCDQMDAYDMLPTKENMENAADQLHEKVLKQHPEIAEYAKDNEIKLQNDMPEARQAIFSDYGYYPGYDEYRYGHRRRSPLRDILDILLLSEFYRRRRRPYY